ncbi:hypothetical protein BKA56DRAFT_552095 [Ilyonectria sp. MPI-CAGE-AT-0026]|nr:hypothetical protein BKA56DRAFT_552095 [Ilyonectria sp. MPI-CAGE-AT-0026]
MPVTLNIVDHPAQPWRYLEVTTPEALLEAINPKDYHDRRSIIRSSISGPNLEANCISPSRNGFVWAAYHAYSGHHHLTIRPEDIWFSIVTQLSFYINGNAEKLRSFFVEHEGQKKLEVKSGGSLPTADFGFLAECMAHLIAQNVKDAELRACVMPSFSTTTDTDRVVASVLFMGAVQKYFTYQMTLECGIPSVTLLGEVADYEDILARLDKLEQLGDEPTYFTKMLRPIMRYMILSFREPTNPDVIVFWNRIATRDYRMSGQDYLAGWITAFCYWSAEGQAHKFGHHLQGCVLDGVVYAKVDTEDVPSGFATVPVTVDDNGTIHECTMLAGFLGIQGLPQDVPGEAFGQKSTEHSQLALTRIRPLTGWIMYENEPSSSNTVSSQTWRSLYSTLAFWRKHNNNI